MKAASNISGKDARSIFEVVVWYDLRTKLIKKCVRVVFYIMYINYALIKYNVHDIIIKYFMVRKI